LFISFVYLVFRRAPRSTLFPYTTLFRSDQEETDRYWNALVGNGGQESACSWCKDRWGVSWQIAPRVLLEGIADPDPAVAQRIFAAMMEMRKIDVAAIEAAKARN